MKVEYRIVACGEREMRYEVRKKNEDPPHDERVLDSFSTIELAREYISDVRNRQRVAEEMS